MAIQKNVEINLELDNNINLKKVDSQFQQLNKTVGDTGKGLADTGKAMSNFGKTAAIQFAVLSAGVFKLAKTFGDFEKGMSNVSTLIDTTRESMASMQKEVLAISKRTPVAIDDVTKALYDVRSAGISADKAMSVLEQSARLSVAGLSSVSESTNIMTSAMNAFASEGKTAAQISDILFKTVKAGKTTVAELAQAFGATAPLVQSVGVKLDDFSAATAALTTVGVPAAQAQNQIRAAMTALIKPTTDMQKIFKKLGVKDGTELVKTSKDIGDVFSKVKTAADEEGIALSKVFGRVEGLNAVISLSGQTNEAYVKTLASMRDGSSEVDKAFAKQSKTFAASMQIFKNNFQALSITIGSQLAPAITAIAKSMTKFMNFLAKHPALTKFLAIVLATVTALTGLAAILGLVGGQVLQGIALFMKITKVIKSFNIVQGIMNALLWVNPFVWIVVGVAAAVASIIWLVKNWSKAVNFIKGSWEKVKGIFSKKSTKTTSSASPTGGGIGSGGAVAGASPAGLMPTPETATSAGTDNGSAYTTAFVEAVQNNEDAWTALSATMANKISTGILSAMIAPVSQALNALSTHIVKSFNDIFKKVIIEYLQFGKMFSVITQAFSKIWEEASDSMAIKFVTNLGAAFLQVIGYIIAAVNGFAVLAASAAAAAVAMIPIIGPLLAPAAWLATYGLVIGGLGKMVGLARGTTEVIGGAASDTVPAMLTPGEMVVDKSIAGGIRNGELTLGGPASEDGGASGGNVIQVFLDGARFIGDITDEMAFAIGEKIGEGIRNRMIPPLPTGA